MLRDVAGRDIPVTLVAGFPRSGTTWVAEVVAESTRSRLIFEPLSPLATAVEGDGPEYPYLAPDDVDEALREYLGAVFDGRARGRWIDARPMTRRPRGRVVKFVRANLALGWLAETFPNVTIVFVMRDPWSVVRSWNRLGWDGRCLIADLGRQTDLTRRLYSSPAVQGSEIARGILESPDRASEIELVALAWAVHNRLALDDLRSMTDPPAIIVRYADLRSDPSREFNRLLRKVLGRNCAAPEMRDFATARARRIALRPSATSRGRPPSSGYEQFRADFGTEAAERVARIAVDLGLWEVAAHRRSPPRASHRRPRPYPSTARRRRADSGA